MVPAVSVCAPVAAAVPVPDVVVEPIVVAPSMMATVNWSAGSARLTTEVLRLSVGAGAVFVIVQVMASPAAGVTENEVPVPLGRVVADPPAELVQAIALAYELMTEADPPAMTSVRL